MTDLPDAPTPAAAPPAAADPTVPVDVTTPGIATSVWDPAFRAATVGAVGLVSVFAFETMAVTTAMPAVAEALDGLALYGLAFGATVAASVVGMVASGIACDRRGPAAPFALGALLFMAGVLVAGLAPIMEVVVLGRAIQGTGAGLAIVPLYVLVDSYPDELQPKVFAAFAAAWVIPALVGPAIAGILVEQWHWRAVFLLVLVVAIPGALMVRGAMAALPPRARTIWDDSDRRRLGAAIVAALGAGALHLAGQVEEVLVAGVLLVTGLGAITTSLPRLLPDGTARLRAGLPAVVGLRGVAASAFFGAEVLIPLLLTTGRGMHAASAGLVLTGGAVGWSTGSWVQGRFPRPPQQWVRVGFTNAVVGITLVATAVSDAVPLAVGIGGWILAGSGMGLIIPTLSVQVLRLSTPVDQGQNVSALQVADALTTGASLAIGGTLIAVGGATDGVFRVGLALSVAVLLVGVMTAGRIAVGRATAVDGSAA